jgi:hypothetical protein
MKTVIIEGLTQGKFESYLTKRQYSEVYWSAFFPLKNVNTLDGKTLIGAVGSRVAAMVISYDSKSPEAGRKTLSTQTFDIPKVSIKRVKTEQEILEHKITQFMQGNDAVIEDYFNDADFVVDACIAREEFFALQALSKTKLQLSVTNNPQGIINETVIDFGMAAANKKVVAVVWSAANAATMTPIADFKAVVKAARAKGLTFTKALMHPDAFDFITASTEFQTAAKSLLLGEGTLLGYTGLETVNKVFKALRVPEIVLIDTSIGIEAKSGVITQMNPWDVDHVLFISDTKQGNMFNGPIAEEIEKPLDVLQAKNNNVLVSVKKGFDPVNVTTKGECNVFPSWPNVNNCFNMYTASASTWA